MGVIGVVAALTIPNLNNSTGEAEKVAKVKKIYAELNEAHNRAVAKYGPVRTWFVNLPSGTSSKQRYFDRLTQFMKITKSCRNEVNNCMYKDPYKYLRGADFPWNFNSYPSGILSSGWSFYVWEINSSNCTSSWGLDSGNNIVCGHIAVDIDGPNRGKSISGIDMFEFIITKDSIIPYGGVDRWNDTNIKPYCFNTGHECAAWVINAGNMDYLDTDSTGKCKNSNKTLSVDNSVFSCK